LDYGVIVVVKKRWRRHIVGKKKCFAALIMVLVMVVGNFGGMGFTLSAKTTDSSETAGSIVLATNKAAAPIYIDATSEAYDGLSLVAESIADDIEALTTQRPEIYTSGLEEATDAVVMIAGTIEDQIIQDQNLSWKISASHEDKDSTEWERYQIQVTTVETSTGTQTRIIICGSDKRGTIYGMYHITQDLCGVSPWIWWADVMPDQVDRLAFTKAELETTSNRPSVSYRGFFLNDENPCLDGFADLHYGGLNYLFYDQVYQLMLRLKANYLWPAMWTNSFSLDGMEGIGSSSASYSSLSGKFAELEKENHWKLGGTMYVDQEGNENAALSTPNTNVGGTETEALSEGNYPMTLANAVLADRYGIVISLSHHEPMARSGPEWQSVQASGTYSDGDSSTNDSAWNYATNATNIYNFWSDGIYRNGSFTNLLTIGMRGENDAALTNADGKELTTQENAQLLKDVIADQKKIMSTYNLSTTPQLLILYKEVETCWYGGTRSDPDAADSSYALKDDAELQELLKDDIIMYCEDNNGYLRTLPELGHEDDYHYGMYYHFDYVGSPRTSMWINTITLQKIWDNMTTAYEYGVDDAWVVNVGDLKPMEYPLSYFLDMAYDYDKYGISNPNSATEYTINWVKQQIGSGSGLTETQYEELAQLLMDYSDVNADCKPETLLSSTYSVTNYNEALEQLERVQSIIDRADEYKQLFENTKYYDTFYELIYYPAAAAANVNRIQILQGLNQRYAGIGSTMANVYGNLVEAYLALDEAYTAEYNTLGTEVNGLPKWEGMMTTTPDYSGSVTRSDGRVVKATAHMNYQGWNGDSATKITPTYVTGTPGTKLIVDVTGVEDAVSDGTITMLDFENTQKQAYALNITNGGSEELSYTATPNDDWILLDGENEAKTGSIYNGTTIGVSIDWTKLTNDVSGTITVDAGTDSVTVQVTAKLIDTSFATAESKTHFMSNGEISIGAEQYAAAGDAGDGNNRWLAMEDYGKSGTTLRMENVHASSYEVNEGPYLDYNIYVPEDGSYRLTFYVGQSNNVSFDEGTHLNLGLSVDEGTTTVVNTLPDGYVAGSSNSWSTTIMNAGRTVYQDITLTAGTHTIRIYGMDTNLLLQKMVLTKGKNSPKTSFFGPKQTYNTGMGEVEQQPLVAFVNQTEVMAMPGTVLAKYCTNDDVQITDDKLCAEEGITYTYPVKFTESGNYLFSICGKAVDKDVTVTLKVGEEVRKFTLNSTEAVYANEAGMTVETGDKDIELTVSGEAELAYLIGEVYDETEGRLVILRGTGGDSENVNKAMDRKNSTSWNPTEENPSLTLDFGDDIVYADNFKLVGGFTNVTSYRLQCSADNGQSWTDVYISGTAPVTGQKVYFQGTEAFKGNQWRFLFEGNVDKLNEVSLNTFVNWALEDSAKTYTSTGYESGSSDMTKTADGNRIGYPKYKNCYVGNNDCSMTVEFTERAYSMTGVNIVAMQKSVDDGSDGVIPTDALASVQAPGAYTVKYQDQNGEWHDLGSVSNANSSGRAVMNYIEFAGGESVYVKAITIGVASGYARIMEVEPVDVRNYTIGGTTEGWQDDYISLEEPYTDPTEGLTNLAREATITSSAAENQTAATGYLNDGIINNGNLRWRTNKLPASIELDFEDEKVISVVDVISQCSETDVTLNTTTKLGLKDITVSYWDGENWNLLATGDTANTLVWQRFQDFDAVQTSKIKIDIPNSATMDGWARVLEIQIWGEDAPADPTEGLTNLAADATITSSTAENQATAIGYLNDGIIGDAAKRWRTSSLPAFIELDFGDLKEINLVDVISQCSETDVTLNTTTKLGLKNITLSYWDGENWNIFATGDTTNTLVWQRFQDFEAVQTSKIRVDIPSSATMDGWARILEIQVFGTDIEDPTVDVTPPTDSGNTDTGSTDTGNTDTGNTDTGNTDTGNTDTGSTDSGNTDTGNTDSGNTDSGNTDTGSTDDAFNYVTISSNEGMAVSNVTVDTAALNAAVFTAEEQALIQAGAVPRIVVEVEDIAGSISEGSLALIQDNLGTNVVGAYLDITISKQLGDSELTAVTELNNAVRIAFTLNESLITDNASVERVYQIMKIHDGNVALLDAAFDKTTGILSFETSQCSEFILIYHDVAENSTDTEITAPEGNTDTAAGTSQTDNNVVAEETSQTNDTVAAEGASQADNNAVAEETSQADNNAVAQKTSQADNSAVAKGTVQTDETAVAEQTAQADTLADNSTEQTEESQSVAQAELGEEQVPAGISDTPEIIAQESDNTNHTLRNIMLVTILLLGGIFAAVTVLARKKKK
jgi:hypothetical protein